MIGRKLKVLRIKSGYNQEQIAEVLGVKREIISYYENDVRTISTSNLIKLLKFYGLSLKEFTEGKLDIQIICNVDKKKISIKDMEALVFINNFVNNLNELKNLIKLEWNNHWVTWVISFFVV